jgi:hypothetical protein
MTENFRDQAIGVAMRSALLFATLGYLIGLFHQAITGILRSSELHQKSVVAPKREAESVLIFLPTHLASCAINQVRMATGRTLKGVIALLIAGLRLIGRLVLNELAGDGPTKKDWPHMDHPPRSCFASCPAFARMLAANHA